MMLVWERFPAKVCLWDDGNGGKACPEKGAKGLGR